MSTSQSQKRWIKSQSQLYISNLSVQFWPERISQVAIDLEEVAGAQVHAIDNTGKATVVIEESSEQALLDTIDRVKHVTGVVSASRITD